MKLVKIKLLLVSFFLFGTMNVPYFCLAAETQIEVQEGEINVEVSPNNPQPYDNVTITLSSYATDLNKAIITWSGDKGIALSGIGKTSYSFKAGGTGSTDIINIRITPSGGMSVINKRIVINPSEVEIMWESADGYVPPFYRGKSLPVSGGLIRAVAIPNTTTIASGIGSITYTWKNTGDAVPDASGYNKNSYVFKNSIFDDTNEVTVTASAVSDNYGAENTVIIPLYKPKIVFYKRSPTEGILYNKALSNEVIMTEDEMTLVAEPYFLSMKDGVNNLTYSWQINGQNIATPYNKSQLTVRPTSRGGYSTIDITIENLKELFQKASNSLKINL